MNLDLNKWKKILELFKQWKIKIDEDTAKYINNILSWNTSTKFKYNSKEQLEWYLWNVIDYYYKRETWKSILEDFNNNINNKDNNINSLWNKIILEKLNEDTYNKAINTLKKYFWNSKEILLIKNNLNKLKEKINDYKDLKEINNANYSLWNNISNQLEQWINQLSKYWMNANKLQDNIIAQAQHQEDNIIENEWLINNKITYDEYKNLLKKYKELWNKWNKLQLENNLIDLWQKAAKSLINEKNKKELNDKKIDESYKKYLQIAAINKIKSQN